MLTIVAFVRLRYPTYSKDTNKQPFPTLLFSDILSILVEPQVGHRGLLE